MEFRSIPSLNHKYEINEDGTIFRNIKTKKENKIKLDMHHSKTGYYTTFIHLNGRTPEEYTKRITIHKVVAECWLGECPEGMEVDHIDRNSRNNHYTNLRYVTKNEQMKNRDHTNISKRGTQNLEEARKQRMVKIKLCNKDTKEHFKFESITSCAKWLSEIYNRNIDGIRHAIRNKKEYKDFYVFQGEAL